MEDYLSVEAIEEWQAWLGLIWCLLAHRKHIFELEPNEAYCFKCKENR